MGYPIPRRPITFDLRQEPGAGKPHVGICAGGEEVIPSLPRPRIFDIDQVFKVIVGTQWPQRFGPHELGRSR